MSLEQSHFNPQGGGLHSKNVTTANNNPKIETPIESEITCNEATLKSGRLKLE